MRAFQFFCSLVMTAFLCLVLPLTSMAEPVKLKTGWLDEHEIFLMWYAIDKGWDKEEGLAIELVYFDSGIDALSALPSGGWVLGGFGALPGIMGNLRHDLYVIGIGNDESLSNGILVRPDSPILEVKGYNKEYPDVYGSPETVKGKEFLVTTISSAHYTLAQWLRVLGLTEADIVIKNMDQPQAVGALSAGIGDGVALWSPHMLVGEEKGWKVAATPESCGAKLPIVLVAERNFADANPEIVAKFLRIYLRSVAMIRNEPVENIVPEYQRFFFEWVGKQYSAELARRDIESHPVFDLEEQLAIFDASSGKSTLQTWLGDIAHFFGAIGRITPEDVAKVEDARYATDKFLKLVKNPASSPS